MSAPNKSLSPSYISRRVTGFSGDGDPHLVALPSTRLEYLAGARFLLHLADKVEAGNGPTRNAIARAHRNRARDYQTLAQKQANT